MSEQTDKWPESSKEAGEVIPPATPGGAATADQHLAHRTPVTLPPGKEDWVELHEELPRPTYWPIAMAVAITLIAFGIVNALLIIIIGIVLLIVSLAGWIGDVRDEARLRKH